MSTAGIAWPWSRFVRASGIRGKNRHMHPLLLLFLMFGLSLFALALAVWGE